jgi:integrase
VTAYLNRHLRAWATAEGLPPFTMYAARKTFASLARKAGVEKATIDECLAHAGDMRMADLYIEKDWRIINDGARMALSLIRWEKRP